MALIEPRDEDVRVRHTAVVRGDGLAPQATDILYQEGVLAVGKRVPPGWQVLTGNSHDSFVVRVGYRHDVQGHDWEAQLAHIIGMEV